MARALSLVALPVLAGLFVTVVMAADRGADPSFTGERAAAPGAVTAARLEAIVRKAPPAKGVAPDARTKASCTSRGNGPLRNPWTCTLHYPSGQRIAYRVHVDGNGSFTGKGVQGRGRITGCCVAR